jgi:predicted nucleic acid-binding protein
VDAEVIALAKKMSLPLLTNDRALATIARTAGVEVKWLTKAVIEASRTRILSTREARSLLRDLVRAELRIRSEVLAEAVHMI